MSATLLIELLTEELPPKALKQLGNQFAINLAEGLEKSHLIEGQAEYKAYAAPRRLAVQVYRVKSQQEPRQVLKKGPALTNAIQDGEPSKALTGFARSCGVAVADLTVIHDGKQEVYAHEFVQEGQTLEALLGDILQQAVKKLPIPKVMRWGSSTHTFVRPVHGLVALHGTTVLPVSVLGLTGRNATLGHRFLSSGEIVLCNADEYADRLYSEGKVLAHFDTRKESINQSLTQHAAALGADIAADESLLDEVNALVEFPVVLEAEFDERFLEVPQECLILTMQQNQKYFPLLDKQGKLMNRFLLVANICPDNPEYIIKGNERVLRARLSDAEFFYRQDQKNSLESRLPKLEDVVYHNKIGSQADRVARLQTISVHIAAALGADRAAAERAARLAKADLLTEMVGEFPELQGVMGRYYAQHDGETPAIAAAIEQHYRPRFAGDRLPENPLSQAVALADKVETLVGIWGIGLIPTGDKDPYALRRAALGVLRILMETPLSLSDLLATAFAAFPDGILAVDTVAQLTAFMQARLAVLLQNDYPQDVVAAVLAHNPDRLDDLPAKLDAVAQFKTLPEAAALAAANKRVQNLLKKAGDKVSAQVDAARLQQQEEQALFQAVETLRPLVGKAVADRDFAAALNTLAGIKQQVDAFFDGVMVMATDEAVRQNRLALLAVLAELFNAVADIAKLEEV